MASLEKNTSDTYNWVIYKITNPNNRIYIGVTNNIKRRFNDYKKIVCKSQPLIYKSLQKHGFDNHSFEIIEKFNSNIKYAHGKEIFWIRSYMCNASIYPEFEGMNVTIGGRGSIGRKTSEETKEKLRKANLGKKYSLETRKKLSEMRQGKKINYKWSDEKKQRMSELKKGTKHTEEAKRKISESSKGNQYRKGLKLSESHKAALLSSSKNKNRKGRKFSEQQKKEISEKLKGIKRSEEFCNQIKFRMKNKPGKNILQFDLSGQFLSEYISLNAAKRATGMSKEAINNILNGITILPKKYIFKYKTY